MGTGAEHLEVLRALAVTSAHESAPHVAATDVPASYRELSRGATSRALAAGRIDARQAQELLDVLEEGQ
ncbi:hypothetical protein D3C74_459230 [compost metagenome]